MSFVWRFTVSSLLSSLVLLESCGDDSKMKSESQHRGDDSLSYRENTRNSDGSLSSKNLDSPTVPLRGESFSSDTIGYSRLPITTKSGLRAVQIEYSKSDTSKRLNYRAFTFLNRKDIGYVRIGDTVIVPEKVVKDLRAYSIFPNKYLGADTLKKLIVVSNAFQSYACYERGQLVRTAACNTGSERKPTFPGRYGLNWKSELRLSSLDSTWEMPWTFNFHLQAGNAFHQFSMPGRPVSHSCVRQFLADAEWLFRWGKQARWDRVNRDFVEYSGTPVIIIDYFNFARKRGGPWLELQSNQDTLLTLPNDPMAVEEALIPIIQIPEESRGVLKNYQRYKYAEDTLRARGVIRAEAKLTPSINFNKLRREKERARLAKQKKKKEQRDEITPTSPTQVAPKPESESVETKPTPPLPQEHSLKLHG